MNEILIHDDRLRQQVGFLIEIDRLKHVLRRSRLADSSRQENSAEHSWHVAVAALLLAEHADRPVDLARVVKMALIHDIVEIDAGDTFFYDAIGALDKADREARAADRLFGLLPPDQTAELRALWDEFEARRTPEACFTYALDRFLPLLHNYLTGGQPWRQHGVRGEQVMAMTEGMVAGSAEITACARALVADAMAQGFFDPTRNGDYAA